MGRGGDNTNHVFCSATWSWGCVNLQRFLIFTCTWCYASWWGGVGWGGVGIIPTMSLAPLHDLGGMLTCNASLSSLVHDATLVDGVGWGGVGWGGVGIIPTMSLAPLHNLGGMLTCNASWFSLVHDATLVDGVGWGGVGWGGVGWGGDNTNHVSCSATWSWGYVNLQLFLIFTCNRSLSVHTVTTDSCWKQMKSHIPKSVELKVKADCCAYPQLAMEIHTCWAKWLVSLVWNSSCKVVTKATQRVKNARRCGFGQTQSPGCTRGDHTILPKLASRWGETTKKCIS